MRLPASIFTETVFRCPLFRCGSYFGDVEAAFAHVCEMHPNFGDCEGDAAIEAAIVPTTIFHDSESEVHICIKCELILPSIALTEHHLQTTELHQVQVIHSRHTHSLHKLLPSVSFQEEQIDTQLPPTRIVFQQNNWIYGSNRIINIVNEAGAQAPGLDCSFPSISLDNPDESDRIFRWQRVPSIHPVVVYQQENYVHGDNAHITILNGPPAWPMFGGHECSDSDPPIVFSYEQNNRIYGTNNMVNITTGPYGAQDPVKYVQNNYLFGKTLLLNGARHGTQRGGSATD